MSSIRVMLLILCCLFSSGCNPEIFQEAAGYLGNAKSLSIGGSGARMTASVPASDSGIAHPAKPIPYSLGPIGPLTLRYQQRNVGAGTESMSLSQIIMHPGSTYYAGGLAKNVEALSTLSIMLQESDLRLAGEIYVNPRVITLHSPSGNLIETETLGIHRTFSDWTEETLVYGVTILSATFARERLASGEVALYLPEGEYRLTLEYYRANPAGVVLDPTTPTAVRSTLIQFGRPALGESGIPGPNG